MHWCICTIVFIKFTQARAWVFNKCRIVASMHHKKFAQFKIFHYLCSRIIKIQLYWHINIAFAIVLFALKSRKFQKKGIRTSQQASAFGVGVTCFFLGNSYCHNASKSKLTLFMPASLAEVWRNKKISLPLLPICKNELSWNIKPHIPYFLAKNCHKNCD